MRTDARPRIEELLVGADYLLYDNPVLYELMFPDPHFDSARWVAAVAARFGGARRILDVGCGLGREVGYLRDHGYDAVGLECAPRMLAYAREHFPRARFVEARMEAFDLGEQFDAVSSLDSAFLYNYSNAALLATLRNVARHLVPGGLLILEMRNGAFFLGESSWLAAEHRSELTLADGTIRTTARYRIDHEPRLPRRTRAWWLPNRSEPLIQESAWRLLFPRELRLLLEATGFSVLAMFDRPGPHTEAHWDHADAPFGDTVSGRRLHVVARREGGG